MSEYSKCPMCNRKTRVLYRNKPKGERADFVCLACLPVYLHPSNKNIVDDEKLWEIINSRSKGND